MQSFVVNKNVQSNGDYEVHNTTTGCSFMPLLENQIPLGNYLNCVGAVAAARARWANEQINGCYYCCTPCHTS
ncbi:hypothetical protein C4K37_5367 [Pseudomonas chlororaphis subsp. piscium]|uniref:Uncharacterized protein n=1 Tax=Pseudomonas chlororaphis TaxID=587753 RepID=A0AAX3FTX2_9PSED|nr:hypothetical protein C4K37_5367 [Pseudomonas chlororaphis subsp. piscium]AZC46282.1 hypothetical protein C4K36_5381 [Pseudomonas chlororaphis subsp. piscium]VEF74184.1 Uncharacterised protein [Pseudomonas chlororaphis]